MGLEGRVAVVTGAGQGIGRACAEVLAARGADLVLLDRNPRTLAEVAATIEATGRRVWTRALDLTDVAALRAALAGAAGWPAPQILVNNAGFDVPGTVEKTDLSAFASVLAIHLTVPLALMQLLLPAMKEAGWGRIVNVSSVYALTGGKGEIAYSTAKAGVLGLTKSAAREAGRYGVTVNAVLPGLTRTPTIESLMAQKYRDPIVAETPLGRMGEPEEIAKVVAFLASDDASFVTAAGVPVSGGWIT